MAAVGHGGLKEGQIVNKLIDLYQESKKKAPTDEQVLASVIENNKNKPVKIRSTNGVLVNGVVDVNVRFQDAVRQFQVMRLLALLQEDAVFLFTVQTV